MPKIYKTDSREQHQNLGEIEGGHVFVKSNDITHFCGPMKRVHLDHYHKLKIENMDCC